MLRQTSSLKGVLMSRQRSLGRDTTFNSRQKFQHKCKEVMSRHNKLGRDSTSQLNIEKSCRGRENGSRHEHRLKADKLCHDRKICYM